MSRSSTICVALLLCCAIIGSNAAESAKCKNAKKGKLRVPESTEVLVLHGKGIRTFWCNDGTFEYNPKGTLHGDQKGTVVSEDGKWKGIQAFRESDGNPIWELVNKSTKEKMLIVGTKAPDARMKAPNGDPLTWDRRGVIQSNGPLPKMNWVIRSNTTSGDLPKRSDCKTNNDANVPYTATYRFYTCEKIKQSPSPKPAKSPKPSPSPKPAKSPTPAPVKAPSPATAKSPMPSM